MKILLIGADGQLGSEIWKAFGDDVIPLTHGGIEVADFSRSAEVIRAEKPRAVINTAAYHNVPDCEKNPELAFRINSLGVRNLASLCRETGAVFLHVSTDYVFDGGKTTPYTEEDTPRPLNVYGVSKLAGEFFAAGTDPHYIIRTSSLFGVRGCRAKGGKNFVKTMLHAALAGRPIEVTSNVVSSPTYARDAARRIKDILEEGRPAGVYHVANSGSASWYEFAREIFRQAGVDVEVRKRIETTESEGIRRPLFTPLASGKLGALRPWQAALRDYLAEESVGAKEK